MWTHVFRPSALCILHSAFCTLHSALCISPSAGARTVMGPPGWVFGARRHDRAPTGHCGAGRKGFGGPTSRLERRESARWLGARQTSSGYSIHRTWYWVQRTRYWVHRTWYWVHRTRYSVRRTRTSNREPSSPCRMRQNLVVATYRPPLPAPEWTRHNQCLYNDLRRLSILSRSTTATSYWALSPAWIPMFARATPRRKALWQWEKVPTMLSDALRPGATRSAISNATRHRQRRPA
jgi:hypothetical protein